MRCYFKGIVRDGSGNIIPSASVTVYLEGTTTAASIYTTLTSSTAVNSTTSGTDGTVEFYISRFDYDDDQEFKIVISKSGYTSITWDNIKVNNIVITTYDITVDTTVTTQLNIPKGVLYSISSGKILTINGIFTAGLYQVFSHDNSDGVVFGPGSISEAHPEWWGFGTGTGDVTQYTLNLLALQSAVDSRTPCVLLPNGTYYYGTSGSTNCLSIDRAIHFKGAGSIEDVGTPGYSTTDLHYIGSGIGIILIGSGASSQGIENMHLSDFSLVGTSSASGGIKLGDPDQEAGGSVGVWITKGSITRVHVLGFTKTNAYAIRLCRVLSSRFEDIYTHSNYNGVVSITGDICTSLRFINCISRSNTKYGLYLYDTSNFSSSSFYGFLSESNGDAGLYIYGNVTDLNFNSYYSEGNGNGSGMSPLSPIIITGTASKIPRGIAFYEPDIADQTATAYIPAGGGILYPKGFAHFYIDYGLNISFINPKLIFWGYDTDGTVLYDTNYLGYITSNTSNCSIITTDPTITRERIYGNHSTGMGVISPNNTFLQAKYGPDLVRGWKSLASKPYDTLTYVGNTITVVDGGTSTISIAISPVGFQTGKFYRIDYNLTNTSGLELPSIYTGQSTQGYGVPIQTASAGENVIIFQATPNDVGVLFYNAGAAGWTCTLSVKEIPLTISNEVVFAGGSSGGLMRKCAEATGTPSGTTTTFVISTQVPVGARLLGCQLRVETALTTGEEWKADFSGGSTTAIVGTGQAVIKDTRINKLIVDEITATNPTNVTITSDSGNFTNGVGVIRAIVYYEELVGITITP